MQLTHTTANAKQSLSRWDNNAAQGTDQRLTSLMVINLTRLMQRVLFVGVKLFFPGNHATLTVLSSNNFSDHNNNYRTTSACAVWKLR